MKHTPLLLKHKRKPSSEEQEGWGEEKKNEKRRGEGGREMSGIEEAERPEGKEEDDGEGKRSGKT